MLPPVYPPHSSSALPRVTFQPLIVLGIGCFFMFFTSFDLTPLALIRRACDAVKSHHQAGMKKAPAKQVLQINDKTLLKIFVPETMLTINNFVFLKYFYQLYQIIFHIIFLQFAKTKLYIEINQIRDILAFQQNNPTAQMHLTIKNHV